MKRHSLRLLDEDIRIISDKEEAYVNAVGEYILSTIQRFDDVNTPFPMPFLNKALYACVFITDELLQERQKVEELKTRIEALERPGGRVKGNKHPDKS